MTKRAKRLQRLRQNPQNVSFDDLRQVLEDYGFILKSSVGSHHVFNAKIGEQLWRLTVPYRKPHLKAIYVKDALTAIDEIIELQSNDEDKNDE